MIKPDGRSIASYDPSRADAKGFFQGAFNTKALDFDPLINGYAVFQWIKVPKWVESTFKSFKILTQKNFKELSGLSNIELQTIGVTNGFSANEYHVANTIQKQNQNFTIKHQEFSGSPIKNMYQFWITGIRDPQTGIATYPAIFGIDYAAKNHTGEILYINTRPDMNNVDKHNIEFSCFWSAVMPKVIKLEQFNFSLNTHDQVEYDQQFTGDFYMGSKVDAYAKTKLAQHVHGFIELGEFDPEAVDPNGSSMKNKFSDSKSVAYNGIK